MKALEYHQLSNSIWMASLGDSHSDTAYSFDNLALAYNALKKYSTAMEHCQKGLNIRLAALGENHADTTRSYNTLGKIYLAQG